MTSTLVVCVFDDVLAARREVFHVNGLTVTVHADADDVEAFVRGERGPVPDVICMDYSMDPAELTGEDAVRAARAQGFTGRIVGISSDPRSNRAMIAAGADESLPRKAMLHSFLQTLAPKTGG